MSSRIAVVSCLALCLAGVDALAAEGKPAAERLVVFPLRGVNVSEEIAVAATEVLASGLRAHGMMVTDDEAPPAEAGQRGERARALGCAGYIDGKLVRLGSKLRVSVVRRDLAGAIVDARQSEAKTEDDLAFALDRIARAFAAGTTVEATLDLSNATAAETQARANRFELETSVGLVLGGMFGVADTIDTGVVIGLDVRLEAKQLLVVMNAGVVLANPDLYDDTFRSHADEHDDAEDLRNDRDMVGAQFWLGLDVAGYLTRTPIAPYLGAGVGMFTGGRVHMTEANANAAGDTRYYDSKVGFDVHPLVGVEFLRQAEIRIHLELRWTFDFALEGEFGQGPVVLAGIDF